MKPKLVNNWIITMAAFRPDDIGDDTWNEASPKEKAESAEFSHYRIQAEIVYCYNEASIFGCTTLWFGNKDSITVLGSIEEYDKIFGIE